MQLSLDSVDGKNAKASSSRSKESVRTNGLLQKPASRPQIAVNSKSFPGLRAQQIRDGTGVEDSLAVKMHRLNTAPGMPDSERKRIELAASEETATLAVASDALNYINVPALPSAMNIGARKF